MALNSDLSKNSFAGLQTNLKASRNPLIEIVLLIIIGVIFFWFIIQPKKAQVAGAQTQLATLQQQESQISGQVTALKQLISQMQSHQPQVSDLDEALPLSDETINLQLLITSLANSSGVTVGGINISPPPAGLVSGNKNLLADPFAPSRNLQKISGTVQVVGTFSQLQAFLQKIEDSGRIMDVTQLAMDAANNNLVNLNITLNAYYLAPQQP